MLRLIPTTDTDTALGVTVDTEDTLVDTEDMVLDTLVDMEDMVSGTLVDTDSATEATPVVTTASVRLRLSPRLMLMLRLIPTSDTDTLVATDSATEVTLVATPALDTLDLVTPVDSATDTAVASDTTDKKVPVRKSAKVFKTSIKQNDYS